MQQVFTKIKFAKIQFLLMASIVFIVLPSALHAQEVRLETTLDKNEIQIGDHLVYKNTLIFDPQKFRVKLPRLSDTFNHFEIIERKKTDTANQRNQFQLSQETVLTNFDSGVWVIPKQIIAVTPLDGSSAYEIESKEVSVRVNTIAVDTSKPIMPIYEIIEAKQSWWDAWKIYILGFLGLLIFGIILYFIFKQLRNREKKPKEEKKIYVAPWEVAQSALENLIQKEHWLSNQEKQHHTRLTDIIRNYLEDAFELDCFEKTSQEIVTDVKKYLQKNKYKKRQEELDKLRNIFFTADLVKFAKSKPTESEHLRSNEEALSFVESTSTFLQQLKDTKTTSSE